MNDEFPDVPPEVMEAWASGLDDEVPKEWAARLEQSPALRERVAHERALSIDVGLLMQDASPALDQAALGAMVSSALAAQPVSKKSLWWATGLGVAATVGLMLDQVPSVSSMLRAGRNAWALLGAFITLAADVPGGLVTLTAAAFSILILAAWPARRWLGGGRRVAAIALAFVAIGNSGGAHAQRFEGEWPTDEVVTLDLEHMPASDAIRHAADALGLGVVVALDDDPEVSLHVDGLPLRDVLSAIIGDDEYLVRRTGNLLSVRRIPVEAAPPEEPSEPEPRAIAPEAPPRLPSVPAAPRGPAQDRTSMGSDITIRPGERVRDVVTMGGDAHILGEVTGDITTMGGDLIVEGLIRGDVLTMGGDVEVRPGGEVLGEIATTGGEVQWHGAPERESQAVSVSEDPFSDIPGRGGRFGLLFLLGLFLLGALRERHARMARVFTSSPVRAAIVGLVGMVTCVVLTVALTITLVGIPAALIVAAGGFVGLYVGAAVSASVLGAVIPIAALQGRPVAQLALGIGCMLLISFIPFFGAATLAILGSIGFGTVLLTRFGRP